MSNAIPRLSNTTEAKINGMPVDHYVDARYQINTSGSSMNNYV